MKRGVRPQKSRESTKHPYFKSFSIISIQLRRAHQCKPFYRPKSKTWTIQRFFLIQYLTKARSPRLIAEINSLPRSIPNGTVSIFLMGLKQSKPPFTIYYRCLIHDKARFLNFIFGSSQNDLGISSLHTNRADSLISYSGFSFLAMSICLASILIVECLACSTSSLAVSYIIYFRVLICISGVALGESMISFVRIHYSEFTFCSDLDILFLVFILGVDGGVS